MFQSGFSVFLSLLLIAFCWLGMATPATAQPLFTASTSGVAMASKSLFSFSGKRPTNLGVKDGKFASCPGTPNCVNSQAPASDQEHFIEAIAYQSAPAQALSNLKSVVQGMERTKIVTESDNYVYAEFTSALMGYVDDVEFYLDPGAGVIHVRSASRLGQSDLGVNRKRVEAIRARLADLEKNV